MRRGFVALAAVFLFLSTGLLILWEPAAPPLRFVLTVVLVFAMCVLSAAIALATAPQRGDG